MATKGAAVAQQWWNMQREENSVKARLGTASEVHHQQLVYVRGRVLAVEVLIRVGRQCVALGRSPRLSSTCGEGQRLVIIGCCRPRPVSNPGLAVLRR